MDVERIGRLLRDDFTSVEMGFQSERRWYLDTVPAEPGWYVIYTDAPLSVLAQVGKPRKKRNYHIPDRIRKAEYLLSQGVIPIQDGDNPYPVYSGESAHLRSRAREHSFGGDGTGCLAINEYPSLRSFNWSFSYLPCRALDPDCGGDKNLRNYVEQMWRSQYGWPLLCSR